MKTNYSWEVVIGELSGVPTSLDARIQTEELKGFRLPDYWIQPVGAWTPTDEAVCGKHAAQSDNVYTHSLRKNAFWYAKHLQQHIHTHSTHPIVKAQ